MPRPLPRRRRGRPWLRVLSSLILLAALATLLLKAAPLLTTGRAAPLRFSLASLRPSAAIVSAPTSRPPTRQAQHIQLAITAGVHTWRLAPADLARMRATDPPGHPIAVDHAAVAAYVARQATAIDRPGRDAAVLYKGGIVRVIPGRDGQVVDRVAAVDRLSAALAHGQAASIAWPLVNGPTVTNAEALRVARQLRRTLRTTVVWLPQRHWAIPPVAIVAMVAMHRIAAPTGARLVASLDSAALAAHLPGSAPLTRTPARSAAVVNRQGRYVVIPAVKGSHANYAALAAEMLRSPTPPGRAVYHLPITFYAPPLTTAAAQKLAAERNQKQQ